MTYPDDDIVPAWHFYQLSIEHLQIATRAPISAGGLERRLRGWNKAPVTEEQLAIFVILGGVHQMKEVAMMQGSYNSRLSAVTKFVDKVKGAVAVNSILGDGSEKERGESAEYTGVDNDDEMSGLADRKDIGADSLELEPAMRLLTQEHISSLPDIGRFFHDIWKNRVQELAVDKEDIVEPYSWLSRVMAGSGLEFGQSRTPDAPFALGASPV